METGSGEDGLALFWITLWMVFAVLGAFIARRKTGDPFFGFLLGLLLGPIGVLIAAVRTPSAKEADRLRAKAGMRQCPHCAEWVRPEASVCRYCHRDLAVAT